MAFKRRDLIRVQTAFDTELPFPYGADTAFDGADRIRVMVPDPNAPEIVVWQCTLDHDEGSLHKIQPIQTELDSLAARAAAVCTAHAGG